MSSWGGRRDAGPVWAGIALVVVLVLAFLVELPWRPLIQLDRELSASLVRPGNGSDVEVLGILTDGGDIRLRYAVVVAVGGWLAARRWWRKVIFVAAGALLVSVLNRMLKWIIERPRPSYPDVEAAGGTSYPSGHSSGAAALAAVLVIVLWPHLGRTARWVAVVVGGAFTVMIGLTRILLGVHYPSDVLAGWALGVGWVLVVALLLRVGPGSTAGSRGPDGRGVADRG